MNTYKKIFFESKEREFGIKKCENGEILFLVPKQLMPPDNYNYKDYINLITLYSNLLLKYNKNKNNSFELIENFNEKKLDLKLFQSLAYIMKDYIENKEFYVYKKELIKSNKKINWNKTIQSTDVFINKNMVVHNTFISKKKKVDLENEFYKIYKLALSWAFKMFKNNKSCNLSSLSKSKINQIKNTILNFEDLCFKDRELLIIRNLKFIFIESYKENIDIKIGIKNSYHEKFEHIWEHMINKIIPNKNHLNFIDDLPKGNYYLVNQEKKINGLNFKPDHVVKDGENVFILDSKFYDFYDGGSPPKTESISKQENYLKILKKTYGSEFTSYTNFFIFPKKNIKNINPEYFAYHKIDEKNNNFFPNDFKIYCIAIDVRTVINKYLFNKDYENLISELNNVKNKEKKY